MRGRGWVFGDDLSTDSAVMPLPEARQTHDPKLLKAHIMTGVDPDFPRRARPGDIIVAGRNFGHGNPHVWGYEAIREAGLGILAESMARGGLRNAVTAGVLFLPAVKDITSKVSPGDELEVNFRTGGIKNITTGESIQAEPLPEPLQEIIAAGGQEGYIRQKFARK